MKLIATKPMRVGGERLAPGDEFELKRERDAKILKAIGKAKDAPTPVVRSRAVETREEKVEATESREQTAPAVKRTAPNSKQKRLAAQEYQRRDMRAQD